MKTTVPSSCFMVLLLAGLTLFSCGNNAAEKAKDAQPLVDSLVSKKRLEEKGWEEATFAGGCFWCIEAVFERVKGVKASVSGYAGGNKRDPTYEQVSSGQTDYAEAVRVIYDPEVISYSTLLKLFFEAHDPTQLNRQGPDVGEQYRSAVFYHNKQQKALVEKHIDSLSASGTYKDDIVTKVSPLNNFYKAEDYHQDYYRRNPKKGYLLRVTQPKIKKFEKSFKGYLKEEYK